MSDMATAGTADHLWARVRVALNGLRPDGRSQVPAYGQSAIARQIGPRAQPGASIAQELGENWERSAARLVPMSLLVIEIDRMSDYLAAYGRPASDACVRAVMHAIADALPREGDVCLRLGQATFVVALPDQPVLVGKTSAALIAEAVRRLGLAHKESHAGVVTASMGLAVCNPRGPYDSKFFDAAAAALRKAQRKGLGRLHAVDLRRAQARQRAA